MKRILLALFILLVTPGARLLDDATPDYLRVDTAPVTAAPFSVSTWINSDDGTINQIVADLGDSADSDHFWRIIALGSAGDNQITFGVKAGGAPVQTASTSPAGYTVGTWHHLCAIETSATDHAILIDGGDKGTNTTSRTPAGANRLTLGFRTSGSADPFSGKIGQTCIYDAALTDQSCATLAAGVGCRRVQSDDLVFMAPINGGQSPEPDIVGGNDLTLTGPPTSSGDEPPVFRAIMAP